MTGERLLKKQAAELANLRRVLINSLIVFISASLTLIACEVLTSEFLLSEERLASMIDERSILLKENLVGVRTEYVPSRIQPGANLKYIEMMNLIIILFRLHIKLFPHSN